jgi:putative transcriptional regulator
MAIVVSATVLRAIVPTYAQSPERVSLAGQLLIASPTIVDPRFDHTVVLVVRHNQDGAFGIIVNRPVGGMVHIFAGGPVQPEIGFVLHSTDYHRSGTLDIDARVALTSSPEILRDIGNNKGPKKSLVAFGYAGWRPGQLEDELGRRTWFTAPEEPKLIFDDDRDKVWEHAFSRRTEDL